MISHELSVHCSIFCRCFSHSKQRTCLLNEDIAGMIVLPRRSAAAQQTPAIVVSLLIVGERGRPISYIVPGRVYGNIIAHRSLNFRRQVSVCGRCGRGHGQLSSWYCLDQPAGHNDAFFPLATGHYYVVSSSRRSVGRSAEIDANTKTEDTIASGNSCVTIVMSSVVEHS
jgi:hypothetical protein